MKTSLPEMLRRIKHRKWRVTPGGAIRCKSGGCPLTAAGFLINPAAFKKLGGTVLNVGSYYFGSEAIGFTRNSTEFVTAVDETAWAMLEYNEAMDWGAGWDNSGRDAETQRKLKIREEVLKELGLEELRGQTAADWHAHQKALNQKALTT